MIRSVSVENGSGGSSPGCISRAAQSIVVPSSRGGVPVFKRPSANPARSSVRDRPSAGASPARPAGICRSPIWISPRKKVPVVSTIDAAAKARPSPSMTPAARPSQTEMSSTSPSMTVRFGVWRDRLLHGGRVKLPVGLRARAAHGRSFAAVEQPKLNAGGVSDAAHKAIERIDLAHQMTLAEAADRRIAGHGADASEALRDERGAGAHARRGRSGFAAGVPAANHNDIEHCAHRKPAKSARSIRHRICGQRRQTWPVFRGVSRETVASAGPSVGPLHAR